MELYSHLIQRLALPSVSLFTESRFWDIYRAFFRPGFTNAFSPSAGASLHRVREVLAHAYRNVEFYRKRMDECRLAWIFAANSQLTFSGGRAA